mgnify:CR=1 FL=1
MRYITPFLFTVLFAISVQAQDAESFFHRGANAYINSQLNQAIQTVDEGLFQFPNNTKLNELKQKLEEEKEKQEQQEQEQEKQEQNEEQQQEEQQEQKQDQEEGEGSEENEPKPEEGEEIDSKEISKEDAEKILKALAQKEKELLKDFKKKKSKDSATHDKDW